MIQFRTCLNKLSYVAIRSANQAREANDQRIESRKKHLLLMILHFLDQEGYVTSAHTLEGETSLCLGKYEICDNIDLETVLQEYESYYYIRFQKQPRFIKKITTKSADPHSRRTHKERQQIHCKDRSASLPKLEAETQQFTQSGFIPAVVPAIGVIPAALPASAISSLPADKYAATVGGSKENSNVEAQQGRPRGGNATNRGAQKAKTTASERHLLEKTKDSKQTNSSLELEGQATGISVQNKSHMSASDRFPAKPLIDTNLNGKEQNEMNASDVDSVTDKLLKPVSAFSNYNSELSELAQVITRDIYLRNPAVKWSDIIGLDNAKRFIKEAVVYPIKYPQLFTGILSPWKGLLLYGPPGTGKTMLAKAVATQCRTTFFNISASSIVSKWRGDSEKLIRVLFELARYHAPSTIFLDEIDSIMSQRGSVGSSSEHEGSRRMKTELLIQMDGLAKTEDLVFLLAASNLPWELDDALLRRLEKRILVDLPSFEAREAMFQHYLPALVIDRSKGLELKSIISYKQIAEKSDGYSGSDIRLVCKEAAMQPLRKVFDILENCTEGDDINNIVLDEITTADVESALRGTKPSASHLSGRYTTWQKQFESA
ncbi:PREDICTED: katanin p60 ATPase-containing subunit A-like 2 isoform X2 [Priapulus caudatus]|uniref:Katanin p60 ATPase-containing subunit A-like 2 n=1 Tax=Priapulus caudatus TaxID=37621 RepID=A0ABM1E619_PRICU|nr:PREDICTED: katanin p60 ATPase-containing subunit A-like 2 isoform X2 [Priapulus caudatus]